MAVSSTAVAGNPATAIADAPFEDLGGIQVAVT